jgi:hypothetical protein
VRSWSWLSDAEKGEISEVKKAALGLVLLAGAWPSLAADAGKGKTPCKAYFIPVEQDSLTVNLMMVGLNGPQADWYRKNGNQKEFSGVCAVNANESGKPVALESISEKYMERIIGDAPLYMILWEEHRVFVPDNYSGHYAFSANGTLSRWNGQSGNDGKFVPLGPVHDQNRTIFSSSSLSMLKDAIKQIRQDVAERASDSH